MNLFCAACNANHRFTPGDVERIVYVLQAERHTAFLDGRDDSDGTFYEEADYQTDARCLRTWDLHSSWDIEGYQEHVNAGVESRLACAHIVRSSDD